MVVRNEPVVVLRRQVLGVMLANAILWVAALVVTGNSHLGGTAAVALISIGSLLWARDGENPGAMARHLRIARTRLAAVLLANAVLWATVLVITGRSLLAGTAAAALMSIGSLLLARGSRIPARADQP